MKIVNKRARRDFKIYEELEAGIELNGAEVKAVRAGQADLSRAYVKPMGSELFLVNAIIGKPGEGESKPGRSRRLLLHKKQIVSLISKIKAKKLTMVPLKLYNKGRLIKLQVGLAQAKRKYEKKETLKQRDIERDIEREMKLS